MRTASIGAASAVMAAGTVVSRFTGFVRAAVMTATLGVALTADVFNVANTIPNSLYILVGGGVLNTVLVPQLVRAIRDDPDGGEEFAQRLSTAVVAVLLVASVAFVVFAPQILRIYVDDAFFAPERAAQLDSMVAFTRFCLPQVFFYGVYLLLGQMLNARDSYGPMMWSPALNNVVAIVVFGGYLLVYRPLDASSGVFTTGQELWFGLGSTLGIAVQALVLLPVLRRSGLRLRPRWGLRGLGTSARLGVWTVLFVLVNQVTLIVIVNLATAGSAASTGAAAGLTVFNSALLLIQLPHSVITVSLGTALLPAMSRAVADGDRARMRDNLVDGMRRSLAVILPAAVLLVPFSLPLCGLVFGWGAGRADFELIALTVITMAPGTLFFAVQFLTLRGFYAVEDTRTPFLVQLCAVSPVYVSVAAGLSAAGIYVPAAIGTAYSCAYLSAALVSSLLLRRLHGIRSTEGLWRFVARLLVLAVPTGLVAGAAVVLSLLYLVPLLFDGPVELTDFDAGPLVALVVLVVAGLPTLAVMLGLARLLHVDELTSVVSGLGRRLARIRS